MVKTAFWVLTVPLGFGVLMCVALTLTPRPLVDEALLEGDELVVRWRQKEDRIPLLSIDWIRTGSGGVRGGTHRFYISLYLKEPSRFGPVIHFVPKGFMWPPAEEQIRRAHLKMQQK